MWYYIYKTTGLGEEPRPEFPAGSLLSEGGLEAEEAQRRSMAESHDGGKNWGEIVTDPPKPGTARYARARRLNPAIERWDPATRTIVPR